MSRATKRKRKSSATVERAVPSANLMTFSQQGGGSVTIPAAMFMKILGNQAPQKDPAQTFAPGAPLEPIKGVTPAAGPRQWAYPIGINLNNVDRTLGIAGIPTFEQLRTLAMSYSGIGLAERTWCDLIPRMELQVTLRKHLKAQGMDDKDFQPEITKYKKRFEKPDGQDDYHEWLRKAIADQTQVDGLVVYKRRTRGGQLFGLDLVDPATIKPLLDERGRIPIPPYPAYQQYPYGVPGEFYRTDEMIYYRESPRTFTPYGFSRVERIMTIVNQALRKQQKDLARFTEGNIPSGIMEVPDTSTWTPDQIDSYEQLWNALIAGNAQQQVRVKFTQPGFKYQQLDPDDIMTEFDQFLFNVTLGCYGLSMADVGFTQDIHKSADEGQENMLYRRTLDPIAIAYGRILTSVIADDFHDDRFCVTFGGFDEKEDLQTQVAAYSQAIQYGMIAPSDAAARMNWPDVPKTGPLIITQAPITPLASFELGTPARKAQDAAGMATLKQMMNPPQPGDAHPGQDQQEEEDAPSRFTSAELVRLTQSVASQSGVSDDYRRWRSRALDDVKASRAMRPFTSTLIPEQIHAHISEALLGCQTQDEVREVFRGVKEAQ